MSSSAPRPRTRNQWDEHFKNLSNEKKKKRRSDGERMDSKRTRNEVKESAGPVNFYGKDVASSSDDEKVAFNRPHSKVSDKVGGTGGKTGGGRPRKKSLDGFVDIERSASSSDDEKVAFNRPHSKVSDKVGGMGGKTGGGRPWKKSLDVFVDIERSASSSDDEKVAFNRPHSKVSDKVGGRGGKTGGGRPRKKSLDGFVDLERSTGLENLSKSSFDEPADLIHLSDADLSTTSEENEDEEDEDEDYRAWSSEEEEYLSEGDMQTSCIHSEALKDKEGYDGDDRGLNYTISADKEFIVDVEQERDRRVEKRRHAINDQSYPTKKSANFKTVDVEIEDEDEFPRIKKRTRSYSKKDGEMAEKDGKEGLSPVKCNKPSMFSNFKKDDENSNSSKHVDSIERVAGRNNMSKQENFQSRTLNLMKILAESLNSVKDHQSHYTAKESLLAPSTLPLKFGFEDEALQPHIKSDSEKEIESLFCDLELGLLETETNCTASSVMENDGISSEIDQSPAACCARGDHYHILDEQIGIICKYCYTTILDIKFVLPQFYTPPRGRYDYRKEPGQSPSSNSIGPIKFHDSLGYSNPESTSRAQGTVWDLIPGVEKELYPHQREGFEFMWNNIAGNILTEEMKHPLSGGRGCIISHAPGTGKTRLTIVFLQAFLKLYPTCHPVIIAPKGMLLTWEAELVKWKVNIPFHNLNKKELSENENSFAAEIFKQVIGSGNRSMSVECMRLVKLVLWVSGGSILGVSYQLFQNLVLENGKKSGEIKKLLLECPGLLVLDEGHTPRNENSKIWKALSKVATERRIILSGTPFQNNLVELYNTLCIVNPKLVSGVEFENRTGHVETHGRKSSKAGRKQWRSLTSSIGTDKNVGLKELRAMLDPLVHVHKGTILKKSLPGLMDTLVFLHPTELQKVLLEASSQTRSIFHRIQQVSLISVHPSLMGVVGKPLPFKTNLEEIESVDTGVKTNFVMKLIQLADALGERVLIFSQFLSPLEFIKKQIKAQFSWNEGRELLYMDGQKDEKQRQDSISSFNDGTSEAKVLLASERACSEGINLVGASRVVLLDTVWNPSVEKQAVSRAYRLGQKKVVYVYRLFTSGTEVRQYSKQIQKERISQLLFSPTEDGQKEVLVEVLEDKILEAMRGLERFGQIFEKVIHQPKESDLIEIFGLVDQN